MSKYDGLDNAVIFDFETLSTDRVNGVVVSFAMLNFSESRMSSDIPHTFEELLSKVNYIKFDVKDQVKTYKRKISKSTLDWWNSQDKEIKKDQLTPRDDDKSISELYDFFMLHKPTNANKYYSRGNTFDPIILDYIMEQSGKNTPYNFWETRDTRSVIDGLSWGTKLKNNFTPEGCEGYKTHDPRHDIALDVMRIQSLVLATEGLHAENESV